MCIEYKHYIFCTKQNQFLSFLFILKLLKNLIKLLGLSLQTPRAPTDKLTNCMLLHSCGNLSMSALYFCFSFCYSNPALRSNRYNLLFEITIKSALSFSPVIIVGHLYPRMSMYMSIDLINSGTLPKLNSIET